MKSIYTLALCLAFMTGSSHAFGQEKEEDDAAATKSVFSVNRQLESFAPTAGGTGSLSPITNHGGPVLGGTVNVYLIWYGNWVQANGSDNATGQNLVRSFLSHIGGSAYFNINTTYPGVGGSVTLKGETTDTGSAGNQTVRLQNPLHRFHRPVRRQTTNRYQCALFRPDFLERFREFGLLQPVLWLAHQRKHQRPGR